MTAITLPSVGQLRAEGRLWAQQQGRQWIFVFKLLLAMWLAYTVAMLLQMPHTRSAALTVVIVMQPQTGQVLTKSIYRIFGTVAGLAATLILVDLFHQQPELFLLSSALWAGLCVAGAIRYRDMRAYAFLLAGYTIGLIGLPAAIDPDIATTSALGRMLAVIVGIVCGGVVSALIFPTTTSHAMRGMLAGRIGTLAQLAGARLRGELSRDAYNRRGLALAAQAIAAQAVRQAAVIENPQLRRHNPLLLQLNSQFMTLGTQLQALTHFIDRLRNSGEHDALLAEFERWTPDLLQLLDELARQPLLPTQIQHWGRRLDLLTFGIKQAIRDSRTALHPLPAESAERLDTLAELLFRFTDALCAHLQLYARLAEDMPSPASVHASERSSEHSLERQRFTFHSHISTLHTLTTGLRTALVILVIAALWIATGWSSSTMAVQGAIIAAVLTASAPNPSRMALEMTKGSILGLLAGFFISYLLLPRIDGLPLMLLTIAPVFVIGGWMLLTPGWGGIGFGAMVNFCLLAPLDNPAVFIPEPFVNDSIASVIGIFGSSILLSILFPPSGRWLRQGLLRDLRKLVERSASAPLPGLQTRLDSQSRDLLNQAYNLNAGRAEVQQELLDWSYTTQSVSHALIALRRLPSLLPLDLTEPVERAVPPLATLFRTPSWHSYRTAREQIQTAISTLRPRLEPEAAHFSESPLRQALSYLHLIDSVLTDPQGVFTPYQQAEPPDAA